MKEPRCGEVPNRGSVRRFIGESISQPVVHVDGQRARHGGLLLRR